MPTPAGHAIAGLATAWFAERTGGKRLRLFGVLALACVFAAVIPDIDILFHSHQTYTHSIGAAVISGGVAGAIAWVLARRRRPAAAGSSYRGPRPIFVAVSVTIAYGTHIVLDWLAIDTSPPLGLMALWPFSTRFYLSGANLFFGVSRRYWKPDEFIVGNLKAMAWEMVVLVPIVALAWWVRSKRLDG
jgi:membrane-bound metal-dependent hydrolase YbcI (DUF457 family)